MTNSSIKRLISNLSVIERIQNIDLPPRDEVLYFISAKIRYKILFYKADVEIFYVRNSLIQKD